jgi:sugar phosphate isomerase/epimerase
VPARLISMNNPYRNLTEEIKYLLSFNFDGIELTAEPPCANILDIKKVSRELLSECLIGHTRGDFRFGSEDSITRQQALDDFKRYLDLFRELEIQFVNLHPDTISEESCLSSLQSYNIESIVTRHWSAKE